jgi:ankyrin repeat protein
LHIASPKGNYKTAELLSTKGADVNANERYGCTPLLAF